MTREGMHVHTAHALTCGPLPHQFTPRFNRVIGSSQGVSYVVEQRGRCEWHRRPPNSDGIQRCIPITWNRAGSSRNGRHICTEEAGTRVTGGLQVAHAHEGLTVQYRLHKVCTVRTYTIFCLEGTSTVSVCNTGCGTVTYVHYSNGTQCTLHLDTQTSWGHIDGHFMKRCILIEKACKVILRRLLSIKMTSYHESKVEGGQTPIHAQGEHTAVCVLLCWQPPTWSEASGVGLLKHKVVYLLSTAHSCRQTEGSQPW